MVKIKGYLVQKKLEHFLKDIVGEANWMGRELRVPDSRRRWDMAYQLDGQTTVVEFDGDAHYWDSLKIKADIEKDAVAKRLGFKVVRVPYWVQLTDETALHYFGFRVRIEQDFAHGFIATKIFPASFSELGVDRFGRELSALPQDVRKAVVCSLKDRAAEYGIAYVLPTRLRHLIDRKR